MGMKKIIGFDFDGSIISSVAAKEAHVEWFNILSMLLKDKKIVNLAGKKDYFPDVYMLMERYTGLVHKDDFDKKVMTKMARNLYQFAFLGSANKNKRDLLFRDVTELILELKAKFTVALITTTPEDIVLPIMHLTGFKEFDIVQTSPLSETPSKSIALKRFVKKHGKPVLYVGNSIEDIQACKDLKVKSVLAMWSKYDEEAVGLADFTAKNAEELRKIIGSL